MKIIPVLSLISALIASDASAESDFCHEHSGDFSYELAQPFATHRMINGWGPTRAVLKMSNQYPNLEQCLYTGGLDWQRQRILAAIDYWIKQKLNYCHHYLPDYATPEFQRDMRKNQGGYCSAASDLMPGSPYFQQQVRWNYTGLGYETAANWQQNAMWYGMDCSNYTSFLYDFAFGILFNSKTGWQAGQRKDGTQDNLSPNQQLGEYILDNPQAAGALLCADNSIEINSSCDGHGGYLSAIDNTGMKFPGLIKANDLASLPLYPGDLLFIAAAGSAPERASIVTHVVLWTGKRVGYGENDINPALIAPNSLCPAQDWLPKIGDWVISDSHYQGADYRVLTPCFYLNNLWGVRRVIY